MRFVLGLLLVAALAVGGWFAYQRFLAPADARACARVKDRCGLDDDGAASCRSLVAEVRKAGGDEAAGKLTSCLLESTGCADAAGCATGVGGGILSRRMWEFMDGLRRSR